MIFFEDKKPNRVYLELIFWVGIIATIAYRIIVVLNFYSQIWVDIAWNIGTIGFIWYFIHRFKISSRRAKLIEKNKLAERVMSGEKLSETDRRSISNILNGLKNSKAKANYAVIFISSILALIYSIIIRFV